MKYIVNKQIIEINPINANCCLSPFQWTVKSPFTTGYSDQYIAVLDGYLFMCVLSTTYIYPSLFFSCPCRYQYHPGVRVFCSLEGFQARQRMGAEFHDTRWRSSVSRLLYGKCSRYFRLKVIDYRYFGAVSAILTFGTVTVAECQFACRRSPKRPTHIQKEGTGKLWRSYIGWYGNGNNPWSKLNVLREREARL